MSNVSIGVTDKDIMEIINEEYKVEIKLKGKIISLTCSPLSAIEFGEISSSEDDEYKKMRAVLDAVLIKPIILKGKRLPIGFVISAYNRIIDKSFLQYTLGTE